MRIGIDKRDQPEQWFLRLLGANVPDYVPDMYYANGTWELDPRKAVFWATSAEAITCFDQVKAQHPAALCLVDYLDDCWDEIAKIIHDWTDFDEAELML